MSPGAGPGAEGGYSLALGRGGRPESAVAEDVGDQHPHGAAVAGRPVEDAEPALTDQVGELFGAQGHRADVLDVSDHGVAAGPLGGHIGHGHGLSPYREPDARVLTYLTEPLWPGGQHRRHFRCREGSLTPQLAANYPVGQLPGCRCCPSRARCFVVRTEGR